MKHITLIIAIAGLSGLSIFTQGCGDNNSSTNPDAGSGGGAGGIDGLEISATQCQDGKDNDGDGLTDCEDADCKGFVFCVDGHTAPLRRRDT